MAERRAEAGQTLFLLRDDGGRRALDEARVAELALCFANLVLQSRDFLGEAFALGGNVDFNLQEQAKVIDDLDRRRRALRRSVTSATICTSDSRASA